MMKTSVRIGAFEIDDAELHGESPGDRTLTIPCKSDPDLCMQLGCRYQRPGPVERRTFSTISRTLRS